MALLTEPQRFTFLLSQLVPDPNVWLVSHDDYQKLKVENEILKKALTEIDRSRYGMQFRRDRNSNIARQALAKIGDKKKPI